MSLYLEHFGLKEPPFSITPDPRFVFLSERHRDARHRRKDAVALHEQEQPDDLPAHHRGDVGEDAEPEEERGQHQPPPAAGEPEVKSPAAGGERRHAPQSTALRWTFGVVLAISVAWFLGYLVAWLRARRALARRLSERTDGFLTLVGEAVYQQPSSPTLQLLRHAGCDQTPEDPFDEPPAASAFRLTTLPARQNASQSSSV